MAKNSYSDWDATATNNTDIGGINIAEGCPSANINNALRELMSQLVDLAIVSAPIGSIYATYGGTADAITLTTGFSLSALTTGQEFRFRASSTNTGATTIDVDSIGTVAAKTMTGAALPAGYIRTDVDTIGRYDGTNIVLEREVQRGSGSNGTWVRYADGTQVCTVKRITLDYETIAACSATWTYEKAFSDINDLTVSATLRGNLSTSAASTIADSCAPGLTNLGAVGHGSLATTTSELRAVRIAGTTDFVSGDKLFVDAQANGIWYS